MARGRRRGGAGSGPWPAVRRSGPWRSHSPGVEEEGGGPRRHGELRVGAARSRSPPCASRRACLAAVPASPRRAGCRRARPAVPASPPPRHAPRAGATPPPRARRSAVARRPFPAPWLQACPAAALASHASRRAAALVGRAGRHAGCRAARTPQPRRLESMGGAAPREQGRRRTRRRERKGEGAAEEPRRARASPSLCAPSLEASAARAPARGASLRRPRSAIAHGVRTFTPKPSQKCESQTQEHLCLGTFVENSLGKSKMR